MMTYEWCFKHQTFRPAGDECSQCALDARQPLPALRSGDTMILSAGYCAAHGVFTGSTCPHCRRDEVSVLKGLVDDQGAEIQDLRRQLNELRAIVYDLQRAHNEGAGLLLALHDRPHPWLVST
jgi:hypothetical protein